MSTNTLERSSAPSLPAYAVITGKGIGIRTKEFLADELHKALSYAKEHGGKLKTFNRIAIK